VRVSGLEQPAQLAIAEAGNAADGVAAFHELAELLQT